MNINKLKGLFVEKGYTQQDIARELGITPNTLRRRMREEIFNTDEINKLIEILDIKEPMEIFFANKVTHWVTRNKIGWWDMKRLIKDYLFDMEFEISNLIENLYSNRNKWWYIITFNLIVPLIVSVATATIILTILLWSSLLLKQLQKKQ